MKSRIKFFLNLTVIAAMLLIFPGLGHAQTGNPADMRSNPRMAPRSGLEFFPNPGVFETADPGQFSRVVALAGPKGSYKRLVELLVGTKLVSQGGFWTGAKTLLIVLGNIIGSGKENINIIDHLIRLQQQAHKDGGRIVVLLGEEEVKLLSNPEGYTNPGLKAEMEAKHITALQLVRVGLTNENVITRGRFLRSMPLAARVGTWLFAHGGLYPNFPWHQLQYLSSNLLSRGAYGHPLLSDKNSIVNAKWLAEGKDKSLLFQRLASFGFFGVVFGNQYKSIGLEKEIGVILGKFIRTNVGMGEDEGANPGKLLVFIKPKQMTYQQMPELYSMDPAGMLIPLN